MLLNQTLSPSFPHSPSLSLPSLLLVFAEESFRREPLRSRLEKWPKALIWQSQYWVTKIEKAEQTRWDKQRSQEVLWESFDMTKHLWHFQHTVRSQGWLDKHTDRWTKHHNFLCVSCWKNEIREKMIYPSISKQPVIEFSGGNKTVSL